MKRVLFALLVFLVIFTSCTKVDYKAKADKLFKEGRYKDAIAYYQKYLEKNPDNLDALNYIGVSYMQIKDYMTAIKYFKKIESLKPDAMYAVGNLYFCYKQLKDDKNVLDYAIKTFKLSKVGSKEYIFMAKDIADLYLAKKDYKNAFDYYKKLLDLGMNKINYSKKNYSLLLYNAGYCLFHLKKYDDAYKYFMQSLKLDKKNKYSLYILFVYFYGIKQDYKQAYKYAKEAVKFKAVGNKTLLYQFIEEFKKGKYNNKKTKKK